MMDRDTGEWFHWPPEVQLAKDLGYSGDYEMDFEELDILNSLIIEFNPIILDLF